MSDTVTRPVAAEETPPVRAIRQAGRAIALAGAVAPLVLIGGLKFTAPEIEALKPVISGAPWLAWTHGAFGEAGASYVIGVIELITAALLLASPWSARAGVAGGALATAIFAATSALLFVLPAWDEQLGGFPALNPAGQFLIKDIALLGIALVVLGESLARVLEGRRPALPG